MFIERGVDGLCADGGEKKRAAVGTGPGHRFRPYRSARPRAVVGHHNRFERIAQHLRERPRHDVGWSTGREWDNQADLFADERLRRRDSRSCQEIGAGCSAGEKKESSAMHWMPSRERVLPQTSDISMRRIK